VTGPESRPDADPTGADPTAAERADAGRADGGRPTLRIISGDATDEEIAAILALVSARGAAEIAEQAAARPASVWSAPAGVLRRPRAAGPDRPDGWRTSYWPR